jgi:hypothetical protein
MNNYNEAGLQSTATTEESRIIVADDDGEIISEASSPRERPEGCQCGEFHTATELPCWPCWRADFETVADG